MKQVFITLVFVLAFTACTQTGKPNTQPITERPISNPTSTQVPPTLMPTALPTPEPVGGGGLMLLRVDKILFPKETSLDKPYGWFSIISDDSGMKTLDYDQIYSVSPDGKRMLVLKNKSLALVNPDGTNLNSLDTGPDIFVTYSYSGVIWLSDGRIVFDAAPKETGEKSSMYLVNDDGSNLKKLEKPIPEIGDVAVPLFGSVDAKNVYWVTGTACHDRGICHEKYFVTSLDGTDQNQIWQNIQAASDRVYVSPSGKFIAYFSYFGWSLKNGCVLATLDGQTLSAISDCYKGVWSPKEDKLLAIHWTQTNKIWSSDYSVWTEPGNQITKLPPMDAASCAATWAPDGEQIVMSNCVDNVMWNKKTNNLGSRLIKVSDGSITEYSNTNQCSSAVSYDSKWLISYNCRTIDSKPAPSQLTNLETKETHPVLENFASNDPKAVDSWVSLFWIPPAGFVPPIVPPDQAVATGRIWPKDNMAAVYVPQGEFTMGSDSSQVQANVKPAHSVNLDAFWIDQTEVTNRMYVKCIQDGGCTPPKYYTGKAVVSSGDANAKKLLYENYTLADVADYPILNVSWDQAKAYCAWAGRQLPTEAQWEKAARGTDQRTYPWGEQMPDRTLLNNYFNGPVQIGSYPDGASPYGVLDMAGNVWEFVSDWYARDYYTNSPQNNPTGPATGDWHVVRGGAWYTGQIVMSYYRAFEGSSDLSLSRIGIRCASSQ